MAQEILKRIIKKIFLNFKLEQTGFFNTFELSLKCITFNQIGYAIRNLLDSCYEHQFCKINLDVLHTEDILHDTVIFFKINPFLQINI